MANMQMLNFNNILNVKDSRWLQLEVCREFQRNKCTRPDTECKFAHPPVNVEVQNGRVTACYDSIKGRCNREKPPCKYFHPPQHLKDQLLINGRNHLALKNAFMTQIQGLSPGTQLVHGTLPVLQYVDMEKVRTAEYAKFLSGRPADSYVTYADSNSHQPSSPYIASIPTMANFNPYIASSPVMTVGMTEAVGSPITGVVPQAVVQAQKVPRPDRLECWGEDRFHWVGHCSSPGPVSKGFAGMGVVPYKRPAPEKSGMPVYQPASNAAYQQALMQQLGGQSYVPVSCEYGGSTSTLLALPPPSNADASTHSPPAIHNAASSTQLETPSSSTSSTTSPTSYIPSSSTSSSTSYSLTTNTSSSNSGKMNSLHIISSSASPLPATPMNILSYAGYSLNKGVRPHAKPTATSHQYITSPSAVPGGIPSTYTPGVISPSGISSMGIGLGMPPVGIGLQMPGGLTMVPSHQGVASGIGGLVQAGMPMMPGVGAGMSSVLSPQFVYSQYPSSSVYLPPQLSALSNNQQISWAQAGEQPYKKLKTS